MSLIEAIRSQLTTAIKTKDTIRKEILRVILGDLSTLELRSYKLKSTEAPFGKAPTDEDIRRVIKKLLEGNNETLKFIDPPKDNFAKQTFDKLTLENEILLSMLPKTLSREEIKTKLQLWLHDDTGELNEEAGQIIRAKNDGQATGIAIKYFKENNLEVDGTDVAAVVKELRV
jgi:uncharacterized protein YqeY